MCLLSRVAVAVSQQRVLIRSSHLLFDYCTFLRSSTAPLSGTSAINTDQRRVEIYSLHL